jgi:predicted metal-dependent TIM-barrel fold hydrolase
MNYIDPHIHMVSRTTDDYEKLALSGCVALGEPAFWAGFDRSSAQGFFDYFRQLTEFEPKRASQFGIRHYTWICMNPKESEDVQLSREVIQVIPEFLDRPNVIGIGEIGLNRITKNEIQIFEEQVDLAIRSNKLIMVHTPHLEDKKKGTRIILDVLKNRSDLDVEKVLIDHIEEHTAPMVLDSGYWAGMTLYPFSKISVPRAVDVIEKFQGEKLMANSGGDWGMSDPLSIPKLKLEMRLREHSSKMIERVTLTNAFNFMSQSGKLPLEVENL